MAIYKRGDNWYIDFAFHGQRIREMIGPSRKGAEKVIAKRRAEIAENKFLDKRKEPDPVKFYDFAKEYLEWAKANKKPSSCSRDLYTMRILDKEFEGKTIQEITTWQIEKYKSKRREQFKPATVNRELALLKHMFTKAVEWGKCNENPAKKVKLLKGAVDRVRFLMPDELQRVLCRCGDRLQPVVMVAVHTGMRQGELLGLKWDQVNVEQGMISILDTKNHTRRDIPMNETVKAVLRGIEKRGEYVFSWDHGGRFSRTVVQKGFRQAVREAGIEDFRFHDLRHTFASNLVMQEGVELNDVRELLGHKTMSMTLRYAHLSPKHKTRVVSLLDGVMSQNPPQAEKVVHLTRLN